MEPVSATLLTFGAAILLVSWVLLIFSSAKDDFAWGLCSVLLPPVAYLYGLLRLDVAKDALLAAALGWLMIGLSFL